MQGTDPRIRLAYFVPPSPDFAGVERVVHEIATGLAEAYGNIFDVHVIFATRYEDDILKDTLYSLHVLDVDRLRGIGPALRACVVAHDYDILICAQVEPTVVAWLATRGLRLPIFVSHLHGNPRLEEQDGSSWQTRTAFSLFRHVISRHVAGVLAVSPSLRRYAAESVTEHAPVYFAKNPARDLGEVTAPAEVDSRFRFLNVARLSRQKGIDLLIRAVATARTDLPPITVTLVGSGPDEPELRRLAADLAVDDVVEFAGYTADPSERFRAADCFVLPSRWEGFPLVLLEALRFGLPLLAADCEFGPADLITDPRIGELVAVEDVGALAEGLKRAVRRVPDPEAEGFRRATAAGYSRAEATKTHFAALTDMINAHPALRRQLSSFAST